MTDPGTYLSAAKESINLCKRLKKLYDDHKDLYRSMVTSKERDLAFIKDIINISSEATDESGVLSNTISQFLYIKQRMEDFQKIYESKSPSSNWNAEGLLVSVVGKLWHWYISERPAKNYYQGEHRRLMDEAMQSLQNYIVLLDLKPPADQEKPYDPHPEAPDPVGLHTPRGELFQMLSDERLLRVVAIAKDNNNENVAHQLAEGAYNTVRREFDSQAWCTATATHDYKNLLEDILHQLGGETQQDSKDLQTRLSESLSKKRYIIGISGLDANICWNNVISAFPPSMNSRIIVTLRDEDAQLLAHTFHDNRTPVYMKVPDTKFMEEEEAEVVKILHSAPKNGEYSSRHRMFVTVSGWGGSGKTVLAKAVYEQVRKEFKHSAICEASGNGQNLLQHIIDQLGSERERQPLGSEQEIKRAAHRGQRSDTLKGVLSKNRYIIMIDGLEDTSCLRDVLCAFPNDNNMSRIIVTTRSDNVVNTINNNDCLVYKMQPLDEPYAKRLLLNKVFGRNNKGPNNLDQGISMILDTCEYLPLAIDNMGAYLLRYKEDLNNDECVKACKEFGTLLANKCESFEGINYVLTRSYNSLNGNAKNCLLSLSTYCNDLVIENYVINDHVIKGKPLVRRLLAEGMISAEEKLEEKCFEALRDHNFIVPVDINIRGQVKTFRVNRMLPRFIYHKGNCENYVTRVNIEPGKQAVTSQSNKIIRLYLHNKSKECFGIGQMVVPLLYDVQLLTFHGEASKALMDFKHYKFLKVLILENCKNMKNEDISTVRVPELLSYLSIRSSLGVTKLPRNIENMHNLTTLDTRNTMVHDLPEKVLLLPKLAHLFGKFQISCTEHILQSSNKICPLETLAGFYIDVSTNFLKLFPGMHKLRRVKFMCQQSAPSNDSQEVKKDLVAYLNKCFGEWETEQLIDFYLSFDFGDCDLDFLKDLCGPVSLFSLKLCGKLTKLPDWINQCHVKELCLSVQGSNNIELILERVQSLQSLYYLKLVTLKGTEDSSDCRAEELITWHSDSFENLKRLCLDVPELPKIVIEKDAMKNLRCLHLSGAKLGGFNGIWNLLKLEQLILHSGATGSEVNNLLNQVKELPMRPTVLRSGPARVKTSSFRKLPKKLPERRG